MQPRLHILVLALLGATAACETSTDPLLGTGGGGGTLTATEASGTWNITLQRTSLFNCSGALGSGQVITARLTVLSDGTVTTPSNWQNPLTGAVQTLSGSVNLTTGAVDLVLGAGVNQAMEMFPGTMTAGGAINGATITDPGAGFSSQVFGTDGCQYTASGVKTGG